ncbi:MAG TPA: SRPBCC domain-containing protein [Acidimicrobiales bacterium]
MSAPPAAWAAIADPGRLAGALPGCRSVTSDDAGGEGGFHVVTEVAVASVRGLWAGTVVPVDADAVRVRGSGAPGTVDLVVRADADRTVVTVEGTVEGPLGTVGAAVLAAAVRRTAHDLLAAAAAPAPAPAVEPFVPARGHGFRPGEAEVMGSGSGTHDLGLGFSEPMTSGRSPRPGASTAAASPGRRLLGRAVAVCGAAAVVVAGRRWLRRGAAAGRDAP